MSRGSGLASRIGQRLAWSVLVLEFLLVQVANTAHAQSIGVDPSNAIADCQRHPGRIFGLRAYNANITTHPRAERVKRGDLVEFNPGSLTDPGSYLRQVKQSGGLPEWYWVGVNCEKGADCNSLRSAGAGIGSTGTAEWNKTEQRIADLRHPAAIARAEREMERALRAAGKTGSDLAFRIDNMHDLDDARFYDRRHVRSFEELRALTDAWDRVVSRLRASGLVPRTAMVGLTAHNNFAFWERHLAEGGTPPLVLRMENPTQFTTEFATGLRVMAKSGIPMIAVEFRNGHKYKPTPEQIRDVASKVSLLVLMENEDNYEDGTTTFGPGPRDVVGAASGGPLCHGAKGQKAPAAR